MTQPRLTIGMATYHDYDGVFFTVQALKMYQDMADVEVLVIDNFGCRTTEDFAQKAGIRYVLANEISGTAAPRDRVFQEAQGEAVLCMDCHVLLVQGAVAHLKTYYDEHPDCLDLLQGPLIYDDLETISTHFRPEWRDHMWGTWETDERGFGDVEFDIPMQGLGVFSCRKSAWLGFNPDFRGFGGEEGYIHEKFRQAGRRCLCLPWLKWSHRFGRPNGVPYQLSVEDKMRNYLIGHKELGLPLDDVFGHFIETVPANVVARVAGEALGKKFKVAVTEED